jgi:phosphoserine phosphatase
LDRFLVLTSAVMLPDSMIAEVGSAVSGAGFIRRLADNAAEMSVSALADDAAMLLIGDLRARMAGYPIDLNLISAVNRHKRLLICDMDSTIIPVECIDEIADFAGVRDHVSAITERAMQGELNFEAALKERVALLRGLSEATLQDVYEQRVTLNPGAVEMVAAMRAAGAYTALVSGGFTYFTVRVAAAAGFEYQQANTLPVADGKLTGEAGFPILGREAKLEALERLAAERGLTPADAVAVGDGANDLAMIGAAGLGVAYRAKPAVAAQADARLDHSDLTAILRLQGIPARGFA